MENERLNAVLAHSMLNSICAVKGALLTVLSQDLDGDTRLEMLEMAIRRLDLLAEEAADIARGMPSDARQFLNDLRR
jgi:nicotinic acid mononucleotide adenylyltransferase